MNVRRVVIAGWVLMAVCAASRNVEGAAQAAPERPAGTVRVQPAQPGAPVASAGPAAPSASTGRSSYRNPVQGADAQDVRGELEALLARQSPNLGRILALDPLLLQNASYLEPYPELAAFLGQHPEIVRNPSFYLARFRPDYSAPPDRDSQMMRMWNDVFLGFFFFGGFCVVTGSLVWLVKTVVDYRRWSRLSKVQTDAHNKLLDRLTANDELMAYVNTPAGKRFLESAPIALDPATSIASPLQRILWAVEIGVVLICVAAGMLVAEGKVPREFAQPFSVCALIVMALGAGFVLAAGASYLISRRMGVLPSPAGSRGADAQPAA